MPSALRPLVAAAILLSGLPAGAQNPSPSGAPAPQKDAVAATVNGQTVSEFAVRRALRRVPPQKQAEAREEIVNLLVDNVLVEQYLLQMRVQVDDKAVDTRLDEMRAEAKKQNKGFDEELKNAELGLEELRAFVRADLRWEAFAAGQADEAKLRAYFDANKEMFDGSSVRARHILITLPADTPAANADAVSRLQKFKRQVEEQVAAGLAKLPADADKLAREKARQSLTDETFAALAKKESSCPSKEQGGDVGWFTRAGTMVEPFSRAAYACKPYEITDPVKTQFGYHVILVTDRKPGRETKYEDVKQEVKDVYGEKLREAVVTMMRQRSKIELTPVKP